MSQKGLSWRQFWPAIAWFVLLCILVFMPGSDVPSVGWLDNIHADKIAHVFLFAVLVILIIRPFLISDYSRSSKLFILILVCLFAIGWGLAVEFIQKNFVTGRTFDLWDWAADTAGVLIGLLIYIIILTRKKN